MRDLSHIYDLQCQILNPLSEARDWTRILTEPQWELLKECFIYVIRISEWMNLIFISGHLFRASPVACGGSQARGHIGAEPPAYTTAHGNARSLTHWVRPGIASKSSWILVRFLPLSHKGTPVLFFRSTHKWDPVVFLFFCLIYFT